MSPLDEELRAALHGRAQVLAPSPEPLAGIERRARRIQRKRVGAAVAGSVLAVVSIAAVVPALQTATTSQPQVPRYATSTEPTQPPTLAARPANAVRWPSTPLDPDQHDDFVAEWATTRERPGQRVEGEVLYTGRTPGGREVYVFQLWFPGEPAQLAVMISDEAGPLPLGTSVATPDLDVVRAIVPGDEFPYVLVLPRPGVDEIRYAEEGATFTQVPLQGRAALPERTGGGGQPDRIQLLEGGRVVYTGEAEPGGPTDGERAGRPDNLLDWPARGQSDGALVERAVAGFARAKGVDVADVGHRVLFTGDNDPGQRYTLLQAWVQGEQAQVFGWIETPGRDPEPQLRPTTEPRTPVVALLLTDVPGRTTDELVVVPQPRTGQVFYGGIDDQVPVDTPGLDGVVLIDRARDARADHVRTLDGDGRPVFDGTVASLLCGEKGCDGTEQTTHQ